MNETERDQLCEKFSWCRCISGEILEDTVSIINLLKSTDTVIYCTDIAKKMNLDGKYVELILIELDRVNITEHGCAVRGSWIKQ